MRVDLAIDIKSDVETVFSWLAEPEKAMRWQTSVAGGEIIEKKPGMVGTTFRERVEDGEGGMDMEGSITAFEPNHRIAFYLVSRVNEVSVDYRVEPVGDMSRVSYTAQVHWKFPVNVMGLFAGSVIKRKIMAQSEQEFARLKELCEGPNAPASG